MVSETFKYFNDVKKLRRMKDKEKSKVRRHFSYNLLSAAVGTLSSSGGDGIWEEMDVSLTIERFSI